MAGLPENYLIRIWDVVNQYELKSEVLRMAGKATFASQTPTLLHCCSQSQLFYVPAFSAPWNCQLPYNRAMPGNQDFAVLRSENQSVTHVTPQIAELIPGLVREEIYVIVASKWNLEVEGVYRTGAHHKKGYWLEEGRPSRPRIRLCLLFCDDW